MTRTTRLGLLGLIGVATSGASAAVNVFDLNGNPDVAISVTSGVGGTVDIVVTLLQQATSDGVVFVETSNNDPLGFVYLNNRANGLDLSVRIRGQGGDLSKRPVSIQEIIGGNSSDNLGDIILAECNVIGTIECIKWINQVQNLVMGGNTAPTGGFGFSLALDRASGFPSEVPSLVDSTIGGFVLNVAVGLPHEGGSIDNVWFSGSIGRLPDQFGQIAADEIRSLRIDTLVGSIIGVTTPFVDKVQTILIDDASGTGAPVQGFINLSSLEGSGGAPGAITIANGLAPNGFINFKKRFDPGAQIDLPAAGLSGNIVIGADGSPGDWQGQVVLGGASLDEGYSDSAASIGSGCAGIVPFKPHLNDSDPAFGSALSYDDNPATPVYQIRHYGLVAFDVQASDPRPIRLFRRARCIGVDWLDVTDAWQFGYETQGGGLSAVIMMEAGVSANYRNGFEYSFSPTKEGPDRLVCEISTLPLALSPSVATYPAEPWFTVGSECPWDTDNSGEIDVDDLNAVLGDWGISDNNLKGDINGDGVADVEDLNTVLSHWAEVGCAPCAQNATGGGGEGESLLMPAGGAAFSGIMFDEGDLLVSELGYATVEAFCADLAAMDNEEQQVMLMALEVAAEE
ncbi:MAG: hypothetical protein R3B46_01180 [Phycisphaerales bacterium]